MDLAAAAVLQIDEARANEAEERHAMPGPQAGRDTRGHVEPPQAFLRLGGRESAEFPESDGRRFGAIVESVGTPAARIVVERAMYSSHGGVFWAAGSNALATRVR